jgi:hypothetical protein
MPTCGPRIVRSECRRENRSQGGDRTVHQADEPGLHDLKDEAALGVIVLLALGVVGQASFRDLFGGPFVLGFRGRQVSKQPADIRIRGPRRRLLVEPGRVLFHLLGLQSYRPDALQADLPEFLAVNEPPDVLAPDQRNMFAEFGRIQIDQHPPMTVFFVGHVGKHTGRVGVVIPQSLREIGVDPAVLLLAADRQRQNLLLGQIIERFQSLP